MKRLCTIFAVLLLALSLTGLVAAAAPAHDLNADGGVDDSDLKWLMEYLVGKADLPAGVTEADLDMNGNGEVDIFEAVLMMQYIEGIILELPSEEAAPIGALKVPVAISSMLKGETYRFGEPFFGYGNYAIMGEDGKALVAVQEDVQPVTDGESVYTNCFLILYNVYEGTVGENSGAAVALNPEKESNVILLVGGSEGERAAAKDMIRDLLFEYDELAPEEQKYVDSILAGEAFNQRYVDSVNGYESYSAVFAEDGTVTSFSPCRNGEVVFTESYAYETGYLTSMERFGAEGDLWETVTYTYHENGMPDTAVTYDRDGVVTDTLQRDLRGNTVKMEYYRDGVLAESQRIEYTYDDTGKLVKLSYYYGSEEEPEALQEQIEWTAEGDLRHTGYYSDGTLREENVLYADGRESVKQYEGNGLLYYEAFYGADGELEYQCSYDEGVLMFRERSERETDGDGVTITRVYRTEKGGEEYLASSESRYPDGSLLSVEYNSEGAVVCEHYENGQGLLWDKSYEDGVLREEVGVDSEGYYSRTYDEEGNWVAGERHREIYRDGTLAERLEYVYTAKDVYYLYRRTLFDQNGWEIETFCYTPDGSLERHSWSETYVEDGNKITVNYEQSGNEAPEISGKEIHYADGGSRWERYEEGTLVYLEGFDAYGSFYYTEYEYWQTENGKILIRVYSRYQGKGYSEVYYREDGSIEYENAENADGSGYFKAYAPDGTLLRHEEKFADGTSHVRCYYESGVLEQELFYDADGRLKREISYDSQGNVLSDIRH